jgi:cbb3-type cytochrome oxidase subunit 1
MLPLRFVVLGVTALLTGVLILVFRPEVLATYHYNQWVLAVTHLFTLGWISSIIMGSMYQLVPVALETKLFSERLVRWQFALHLVGVAGMVWMFWIWDVQQMGHFGSVVSLGIGCFLYNIGRTLARIPRWNLVAAGITAAMFWLTMTMLAGLYVAASKCWSFSPFAPIAQMHAHAHLGGLGFFLLMIVGVSYKLVPMFALSEVRSWRRAGASMALLNAGLAGVFVTVLLDSPWKLAFALVTISGLAVYGWEMRAIVRARKRKHLDWGLKYFLTALGWLAPLAALSVVLCWPGLPATALTTQLENVYGFLALAGVVTLAILGMLYKIVPFLVWYARYSPLVGRSPVPALADMYSTRLQAVSYWLFLPGLLGTAVATALGHAPGVRWGCVALAGGVLVFAINLGRICSHLVRPKPETPALTPALETKYEHTG